MDRSLRLLCALLVVVAGVPVSAPFVAGAGVAHTDGVPTAPVAQVAQVQPPTGQNTTSVLLLSGETTTGYARSTVDIGPVVSASRGVVNIELQERIVTNRLGSASTVDRRRQVLRQETERLAEEVAALQQAEQRALSRYERGEISGEELLRVLATVDTEARRANELVSLLQSEVAQVQFLSATADELQSLQVELATLYGPVREHAGLVFRGEEPPTRIHVTVAGEAVALATIRDNTYVREATEPANLDTASTDQFESENEVIDRIGTLYPWAWTSDTSSVRTYTNFENGFYRINVDHAHGQLTSYVDGSTQNVFREIQYKSVTRMPTGPRATEQSNGTTLQVNQSFGGGPIGVYATDAITGEPVDGTVYLDGTRVDRTVNGRSWLVGPAGQYEVTVETDEGNVTVTGQALQ
ncbi:DUF7094 domain-containing protein [Salinigranum salinum]|uniref:DUF7094 domain-containing protein n=1 Tax=Salinigranum salinum TaxID=1364937 RepID=UPI0012606A95|nr:hypothetical protein [Salinigranum salinum]